MSLILKKISKIIVFLFAFIGFTLVSGYVAIRFGLTNTEGVVDTQGETFLKDIAIQKEYLKFSLAHTPEWITFKQSVAKDATIIKKVAKEAGISERLLISLLVPEQMRLFYSNRPIFEEIFEPLKILGNQNQFSWGIYGIKEETAREIENNLRNKNSDFYLGEKFESLLDFKTEKQDQERFSRIIDEYNHYYSYLYTALYIAQIQKQWEGAGFSIKDRPEIIATLWNIGFEKSVPKEFPQSGGSAMEINGIEYSFGSIAKEFHYSDELIEIFP